jgi:poly(A) polymerase
LLSAPDPASVLALMRDLGVLAHFLGEAGAIARLAALVAIERTLALPADAIRRLAALLAGGAEAAHAVAARLKLSNARRDRLVALADAEPSLSPALDGRARRRLLYRLGAECYRDRALIAWAGAPAPDDAGWRDLVAVANGPVPVFPVQGRDALALGIPPGPKVGAALKAVEDWWLAGDFTAGREACLQRLKAAAS